MKWLNHVPTPGIRIQLTLWYTIVSALLILFFGIAFYASAQQWLASSFDTTLQMRAQQVAEGVSLLNDQLLIDDVVGELPELDANGAIIDSSGHDDIRIREGRSDVSIEGTRDQWPQQIHGSGSIMVRILDLHGKALYWTTNFNKLSIPQESVTNPLHGISWRGNVQGRNNQTVRLYSTMLLSGTSVVGIVQVGQSLTRLEANLQNILQALLILTPILLTFSAFGSYWLAGRAFRPIHRLAQTAREIGERDLHQRVPVPRARDEVHDLAIIFNQMIERLEYAFIRQRRFVADASHELRTPVAVIRSVTDVALAQPSTTEEYVMVLQDVNTEAERLGRLINDLLALARADEGQARLDSEPVRLDLLAADVVESMETLANERQITLKALKLDQVTIAGDTARIIQLLMGLVDNAMIYNNAGGEVDVSVVACTSHAHVIVHDTGIGIAEDDLNHIFERFYRVDPARSKVVGGSGLGLSIVDWIVRAHGGTITAHSQPGKGSTFTVTLPLTHQRDREKTAAIAHAQWQH